MIFQLFGQVKVILQGIFGLGGVGDIVGIVKVGFCDVVGVFFYGFDIDFYCFYLVEGIEDVENVNVCFSSFFYEFDDEVVWIGSIIYCVRVLQQYLEVDIWNCFLQELQVFLGVFFEEVYGNIESGVVLDFYREDIIVVVQGEVVGDFFYVVSMYVGGQQRLVGILECGICILNGFLFFELLCEVFCIELLQFLLGIIRYWGFRVISGYYWVDKNFVFVFVFYIWIVIDDDFCQVVEEFGVMVLLVGYCYEFGVVLYEVDGGKFLLKGLVLKQVEQEINIGIYVLYLEFLQCLVKMLRSFFYCLALGSYFYQYGVKVR